MFEYQFSDEFDLTFRAISWFVLSSVKSWVELVGEMRRVIEDQGIVEDDYIYKEVKDQVGRVVVEGEKPDEVTLIIHGIKVHKKILHRKSEKYNGADLLMEIEGEKFALIQFKKQNTRNRYEFKNKQLNNLRKFCKNCRDREFPPQCQSYIWLIDDSRYYTKYRILKLCQVDGILDGRESAHKSEFHNRGIYRSHFKELFVRCWEGSYYPKISDDDMQDYLEDTSKIIVNFSIDGA